MNSRESLASCRWYRRPLWVLGRVWDMICLLLLLAVVAAMPLVQLASLGYLLHAAANLARQRGWSSAFPGLRLAGRLGAFAGLAALFWLPVWLVCDLSYAMQLLEPGSPAAAQWRLAALASTGLWLMYVTWAAMRGGRVRHFIWPAPFRWMSQIWRLSTWRRAGDGLYELLVALQFPRLWWLGARAAVGALAWTLLPVTLMIIGQRAHDFPAAAVVGLLGAVAMIVVMLYLPFLQIQMAVRNRLAAMFDVSSVRRLCRHAPWAHALSLLLLCLLCIPLYILRVEATPAELLWAPSLVFVWFMFPAKLLLGAAMGYAAGRQRKMLPVRHWLLRWPARGVALASVLLYVGSLYVAQVIAGQGALVMVFQHAFLIPAPLGG